MKKTCLFIFASSISFLVFSQKSDKYEKVYREEEQGNVFEDSILVSAPDEIDSNTKGVKAKKGSNQVKRDSTYILIYREDEEGNLYEDSVKIDHPFNKLNSNPNSGNKD